MVNSNGSTTVSGSGAMVGNFGQAERVYKATDRAMNALPPDDVDRNLDFDALVAKYEKRIFNLIYRLLGDYEEAADLTQETFINAYKHYDQFRGDSRVFTWLYQIARNHCINRIRRRDRLKALRLESLDQPQELDDKEAAPREIPDWANSPERVLEDRELQERIVAAVASLSIEYREIILLREYQHLSYNEIVEATGLSLENVKTRLSRARGMLRRKLEPYYHSE